MSQLLMHAAEHRPGRSSSMTQRTGDIERAIRAFHEKKVESEQETETERPKRKNKRKNTKKRRTTREKRPT